MLVILIISMHTVQSHWGLKPQNGLGPFFKLPTSLNLSHFVILYMGHYQKMEQSRKAKRKKKIIVQFFFLDGTVLLTRAYRI